MTRIIKVRIKEGRLPRDEGENDINNPLTRTLVTIQRQRGVVEKDQTRFAEDIKRENMSDENEEVG